jgi:hypothetical protein
MKVFYVMCLLLGAIVLALVLVAFGWNISSKIFGTYVTEECLPGETMANIPREIKQLCVKVEHGR